MAKKDTDAYVTSVEKARDKYLLKLKRINDILHPEDDVVFEPTIQVAGERFHCSFCNKDNHHVAKLIAGNSVWICDECIAVCVQILAESREVPPAADAVDPQAPDTGKPSTRDKVSSSSDVLAPQERTK